MSETLVSALFTDEEAVVARGAGEPLLARDLLRKASVIAAILPDPTPGSEVAFSFERDRVACAAALLATWAKGHTATVPEDGTRESIIPLLKHPNHVAFLHDTGVGLGTHVPTLLAESDDAQALDWAPAEADLCILAAYVQPAVGAAEVARWTQAELLRELTSLAEQIEVPEGAHVVSSLTPTALPGLILGLLVPLLRGSSFEARKARGIEQLTAQLGGAHSLVATPAHARELARLADSSLAQLTTLHVVDEGLDAQTAELLSERDSIRVARATKLNLDREEPSWAGTVREALLSLPAVLDVGVDWLASSRAFVSVVGSESQSDELEALVREHVPSEIALDFSIQSELPRDANGRLPAWKHRLLYGYGRTGAKLEPQLEWRETSDSSAPMRIFRTLLPENFSFFEGHYTSYSVLAGAVQLHELVLPCVRRVEPRLRPIKRLSALKFMSRIAPKDEVEVQIELSANGSEVRFEIHVAGERCSAGLIHLAESAEGASL